MRAREFLQENYNKSLDSDLNNILVRAKASGSTDINTRYVVKQLDRMGYSVNVNSIMQLLSNNPVVLNATPEMIKLTKPDGASAEDNIDAEPDTDSIADKEQENADHVSNMAQTAAKKQINK
jgi:hypothetical protein